MDASRVEVSSRPVRIIAMVAVVAGLYFSREVLIPVALAVLLSFLLNPLVLRLQRLRIPHPLAVTFTVLLGLSAVVGVGYLVGHQVLDFSNKLPEYRGNLSSKIRGLRSATDGTFNKLTTTLNDLKKDINSTTQSTTQPGEVATQAAPRPDAPAMQVRVVDDGPDLVQMAGDYLPPVLVPLANAAVVLVLVVFLLLYSSDVRERLIWFAGMRQISLTTAALDEASTRISGYLRMLALVNFSYGVMIAIGLSIMGVPNALFWGVMGAILRFIPFLGPWIAAVIPTLLAIAVFQGWSGPIGVIGVYVAVEFLTNMVLEPWLYGKSTGISGLGVIFAAVFWAWIWGPVGLLLSVPLTVCLLVLGKQLPQLALLNHLFGESMEVPKPVRLYQRVLVGDDLTAGQVIDQEMKKASFVEVSDALFVPVMQELKRDLGTGMIDAAQAHRAVTILDVATSDATVLAMAKGDEHSTPAIVDESVPPILFVGVQNEVDDLAATLLARAAEAEGMSADVVSSRSLASEAADRARETKAAVVCLVQVAPISWTHCRHLAKMLSTRLPRTTLFAANLEPAGQAPPFTPESGQLPVKKLFRDVASLMERLRETRLTPMKPVIAVQSAGADAGV